MIKNMLIVSLSILSVVCIFYTSNNVFANPIITQTPTGTTDDNPINDLKILNYHGYHKGNYLYVIGEVVNNSTSQTFSFVKLTFKLYNVNKEFIGTYETYLSSFTLSPGATDTFKAMIGDTDVYSSIDDVTSYTINISARMN
jgi:hypothetical protein